MSEDNFERDLFASRWNELTPEEVLSEAFHELRNPIYLMLGFINILKDTNQSPNEINKIADSLFNQVTHSKNIIDSVYTYINKRQE